MTAPTPSHRASHVLLRLYPRAWRARYGDEFLRLIEDKPVTWNVVGDVVLAAAAQRLRAFAAFRNPDPDAIGTGRTLATLDAYDVGVPPLVFAALTLLTVAALSPLGLAFPGWVWLLLTTSNFNIRDGALSAPGSTVAARVFRGYYFLIEGLIFAIVVWFTSRGLAEAGVPAPPDGFELIFGVAVIAGVVRVIRISWRRSREPDKWIVVSAAEIAAWRCIVVVFYSAVIIADPDPRMIWQFASFWYLIGRTPFSETPLGLARRRAAAELNQQRLREKFPVQPFNKDWR